MIKQPKLNIHLTRLEPLQVVFLQCTFRDHHRDHCTHIKQTFRFIREWAVCMHLNPEDLLQIGIPLLEDDKLVGYTCCLEYPLPYMDESCAVNLGQLPGGAYATTKLEHQLIQTNQEIRKLMRARLEEVGLIQDHERPIYEIHHPHHFEYCIPIHEK